MIGSMSDTTHSSTSRSAVAGGQLGTGDAPKKTAQGANPGFNFTAHMRGLCVDMTTRVPALGHIDMARVAVAFAQTRKRTSYGMFASLTPMRFEGGALTGRRQGRRYKVQRLYAEDGREMLYILTFYLPRFLDLPFKEKLITVVHELWHISPDFDGDLRRHSGRCYAHTHSQKEYDAAMEIIVDRWLELQPPEPLYGALRSDFRQISALHSRVYGVRIPRPKLLPVD